MEVVRIEVRKGPQTNDGKGSDGKASRRKWMVSELKGWIASLEKKVMNVWATERKAGQARREGNRAQFCSGWMGSGETLNRTENAFPSNHTRQIQIGWWDLLALLCFDCLLGVR